MKLRAVIGISLVALLLATASGAVADDSETSWQSLLEQAEPIYVDSKYSEVLPLYKQAVELADKQQANTADRIKCMRYLADCYCRLNQPTDALKVYERVGALIPADDIESRAGNMNQEALCLGYQGQYEKAESLIHAALKLCDDGKPEHLWELARTQAHVAYFRYLHTKYAEAIPWFQLAEKTFERSNRSDLVAHIFKHKMAFAQAGSYYHLKDYANAYQQFRRLYDIDSRLFGRSDLQTGWACMALSDVLEKLDRQKEADEWFGKAVYVFRKFNKDRIIREGKMAAKPELIKRIDSYVFGKRTVPPGMEDTEKPLCPDTAHMLNSHDPRMLYAGPFTDAPGRVWLNPLVEHKGIVIAIHGLSLNHSAYEAFAREIANAGYCTVAFDVRGFGTYRQALGADQLDIEGCMRDLSQLVHGIRIDNPDMPMFMLGESMGGAIALQFAARNPQLIDGLITAVPAGKRFKQKKQAVKVAMHYLGNKNRPFDIGTDVINQATSDPKVKHAWADDPTTRSTLSPHELMTFQSMFKRNLASAHKIKNMPVIIFQGVSDALVRPEATYELFRAVQVKDKSFVMVGNQEHLIFEEGCFTPPVLKGLLAWMDSHAPVAQAQVPAPGNKRSE